MGLLKEERRRVGKKIGMGRERGVVVSDIVYHTYFCLTGFDPQGQLCLAVVQRSAACNQ